MALPIFLHVGARYLYKNFNGLIGAFGDAQLHRTQAGQFQRLP